jgi:hypothetical protein
VKHGDRHCMSAGPQHSRSTSCYSLYPQKDTSLAFCTKIKEQVKLLIYPYKSCLSLDGSVLCVGIEKGKARHIRFFHVLKR